MRKKRREKILFIFGDTGIKQELIYVYCTCLPWVISVRANALGDVIVIVRGVGDVGCKTMLAKY
jgi:hypothetical protein